jgi:hypothetical protein
MSARGKNPLLVAAVLAAAVGLPRAIPSGSSPGLPAAGAPAAAARPEPALPRGSRAAGSAGSAAARAAPERDGAAAVGTAPAVAAAAAPEIDGWSGPLRLYAEFFGKELPGDLVAADTAAAVARYLPPADRGGGYELDFVVALVPDPIDSEMPAAFDQALDGIQRAFANRFFLLDRRWLPWRSATETAAAAAQADRAPLHRVSPGLLLFRRDGQVQDDDQETDPRCLTAAAARDGQVEHCLVGVFLVGETPKRGIHQAAFLQALRLIQALSASDGQQAAAAGAPAATAENAGAASAPALRKVKIVGPSYSGSADSLRLAVGLARRVLGPLKLEIVTGSATAIETDASQAPRYLESFEQQLDCEAGGSEPTSSVTFWRAVIPDRLLQPRALDELRQKMGWDPKKVALVVEGDTEYGQRLARGRYEERPGNLRGVVRDPLGRPLRHATVTVTDQVGGKPQTYVTDAKGSYVAEKLASGRYTVGAEHAGGQPAGVIVKAETTAIADLGPAARAPLAAPRRASASAEDPCVALAISPLLHPRAGGGSTTDAGDPVATALDDALILHFPAHVAAIRSASAGTGSRQAQAPTQSLTAFTLAPQKTELDLDLGSEGRTAADSVPELSKLTAPDDEQAIANLLGEISREGIGYVGILATDVQDKLYLAARIREYAPDVTLFTFDGDLLYGHRQLEKYMNGMAVVSTFQLFTEGGASLHGVDLDLNHRRQFTSELDEGVFQAVRALLSPTDKCKAMNEGRPVLGWVSVASNGSLWPLLSIQLDHAKVQGFHILAFEDPDAQPGTARSGFQPPSPDCRQPAAAQLIDGADGGAAGDHPKIDEPLSPRADLELLIAAMLLCWLARTLRRAAPPRSATGPLLRSGLVLLALAACFVLALDGIEYLRPFAWLPEGWVDFYPVAVKHGTQWLYLLGLAAAYLFLVSRVAACWRPPGVPPGASAGVPPGSSPGTPLLARRPERWWRSWLRCLGWLGLAVAALAATWFALLVWFIPGEIEYFELRARVFSSGLSPVVSLAWLVGALYLWVLLELKRRCVTAWHEVDWPLPDSWDPALARCGSLAAEVRQLVSRLPWPDSWDPVLARCRDWWQLVSRLPWPDSWRPALARCGRLAARAAQLVSRLPWRTVTAAAAAAALLGAWLILRRQVQPAGESPAYAGIFLALLLLAAILSAVSFCRFVQTWRQLRKILLRVEETPLKDHFGELAKEVAWKPMRSFGWQLPRFNTLEISIRKLEALLRPDRADRPDHLALPPSLGSAFLDDLERRIAAAFAADSQDSPALQIERRRRLQRLLARASRQLGKVRGDPEIEDFLALRVVAYLRYVFAQLRGFLMGGLFPGLLLLIAVSAYAFEPKSFLSLGLLAGLLAAMTATVGVFLGMDRDAVLSRIAGGTAGEVSLDRTFFSNLLTYVAIPLLGLVATQVPAAGPLLNDWFKPLLRIFGLG